MCGILGIYGNETLDSFKSSLGMIKHRGPDDDGIYHNSYDKIMLGHTRLAIQDVSASGHQPMFNTNNNLVIVFNGEIFNFEELKKKYFKSIRFNSKTDTEVLLLLYEKFGEKMLHLLNGIFVFAIWNKKNKSLFIARDSLGVKPLYYIINKDNGNFIFSSEIKSFVGLCNFNEVNLIALKSYLTFLWAPGQNTPLNGLRKMEPGEAIILENGIIKRQWIWYNPPIYNISIKPKVKIHEYISNTQKLLRQSVHRQLISDVPIGAFLSGGLDSSSIVKFAKEKINKLPCFTIKTEGVEKEGFKSDLAYASKVASHLEVPLNIIEVSSEQIYSGLIKMVSMLDEPLADSAPLHVLFISQLAKENGIKVLLSGAGGDDLFTGYRRHYAINNEKLMRAVPNFLVNGLKFALGKININNPTVRKLSKLLNGLGLNIDQRIINYFHWADEGIINNLFSEKYRDEISKINVDKPLEDYIKKMPNNIPNLERMLALEKRFFLSDHNLLYTDKMSMACGVEVRVPFLDNDLVKYASTIPMKYKQRGTVGKWILKKAMEPYLPKDVIYRSKSGFGSPLRQWIKNELSEIINELLSEKSIKNRGIFDYASLKKLIDLNNSGKVDASYTIFSLMCIEIWFRQYIDNKFCYNEIYNL